ncbi:glycosyltransferase family 2 protein [Brevibacillus sp. SAFN-007a]|uniref:glycosyltransferase family 2 protein n=1 Tax=Brevibacillus sp. SAFN-007a TaxID=3436862 RepID=UPI003F80C1E7
MLTSVVIPAKNADDQLLYTLFGFNLQYCAFEEFEVIVLDNASTDATREKLSQFTAHFPLNYVRFRAKKTLAHLLNTGVQLARGELIVFLAAQLIVPRSFIGVHQQAHEKSRDLVLLGQDRKRIYSVYEPGFSATQHAECQLWLEQYPHVKRPHTLGESVPLLEESQIVNGLPFRIGLPCPVAQKRLAIREKYGAKLARHRSPWTLFDIEHVSLRRESLAKAGAFRELPRIEMERDFGKRLRKNGCPFQLDDKLTLLKQEYVQKRLGTSGPSSRKNRRA